MPKISRPHIGKVPMKFYFRCQDITVELPGLDIQGSLVLVWKRGYRRTTTGPPEPFVVKEELSSVDGSLHRFATTTQDLAQICTMFKSSRTQAFESKLSTFTLRSEDAKLGSTSLDLSAYATLETTNDRVELSLLDGKAKIKFTLSSHWLKNVAAGSDDDASSLHSFGSAYTDVEEDLSRGVSEVFALPEASTASSVSLASASSTPSADPFRPMDAAQKARFAAAREAAIEERWAAEEVKLKESALVESLRLEAQSAGEQLKHAQQESKYLRERVEMLAAENRVLRRDPLKGKRDAVIEQLQVELERTEHDKAEMEEQLSAAFGTVVKELQGRVTGLVAERDRLLVQLAELSGKKGGKR